MRVLLRKSEVVLLNQGNFNIQSYDYTTSHRRIHCTAACNGFAAPCPGTSKGAAAIPIATAAADNKRRSSSCDDSADKKFHMPYNRKDLALDLIKVHDDRFSSLGGDKYFACVDMRGTDGRIYDIDFFMVVQPGKLTVTETSVHKINGKPLYNWKQEGGVWKKVRGS